MKTFTIDTTHLTMDLPDETVAGMESQRAKAAQHVTCNSSAGVIARMNTATEVLQLSIVAELRRIRNATGVDPSAAAYLIGGLGCIIGSVCASLVDTLNCDEHDDDVIEYLLESIELSIDTHRAASHEGRAQMTVHPLGGSA